MAHTFVRYARPVEYKPSFITTQVLPSFASDRKESTRACFLKYDPEQTGYVNPELVQHILRSAGLRVPENDLKRFNTSGAFCWTAFYEALEHEVDSFLSTVPASDRLARIDAKTFVLPGHVMKTLPTLLAAPSPYSTPRPGAPNLRPTSALPASPRTMVNLRPTSALPASPRTMVSARVITPSKNGRQSPSDESQRLSPREMPSSPLHLHRSALLSPRASSARRSARPRGPMASTSYAAKLEQILNLAQGIESELDARGTENLDKLLPTRKPILQGVQSKGLAGSALTLEPAASDARAPPKASQQLSFTPGLALVPAASDARAPPKASQQLSFTPGGPGYVRVAKPQQQKGFEALTEQALNSRFKSMQAAFRYVDHNNSGLVDANEIMRALRMWNLPFVPEHVEQLVQQMDTDDDGFVNYREFIDAFARGSTAMASVGRSDVWKSAMTSAIAAPPAGVTGHLRRTLADSETLEKMLKALRRALHAHFPAPRGSGCDPFAAFQAMDAAHKGTIDRREMAKALKSFKVPFDDRALVLLMHHLDSTGDGKVNYAEFAEALGH